jgi:hypothetical protein
VNHFGDFIILTTKKNQTGRKKKKKPNPQPARPSCGSWWPVGRPRGVSERRRDPSGETQRRRDPSFFLLFSSFSFLSCSIVVKFLLQQCGSRAGGCRICFCIFFSFCEVSTYDWWAKNTTFCPIRIEVILLNIYILTCSHKRGK